MVYVHAPDNGHRSRGRQKNKLRGQTVLVKDEDTYDDYGYMDLDDADEEMQMSYENDERDQHENVKSLRRKPKNQFQSHSHSYDILKTHSKGQPTRNGKHYERLMVTKKLNTPEELHEEIDKIFLTKDKNYEKSGHGNSHWELRIVPKRYEDFYYDEQN